MSNTRQKRDRPILTLLTKCTFKSLREKRRCCINQNEVMATPISRTSQIFTDTGMPRSDIIFSADALTHASVFCRASARAFMTHPMMRL